MHIRWFLFVIFGPLFKFLVFFNFGPRISLNKLYTKPDLSLVFLAIKIYFLTKELVVLD